MAAKCSKGFTNLSMRIGWLEGVNALQKLLRVARCIVSDNLFGVTRVDIVNVLAQGAARFWFDFLNFLQSATGDKKSSGRGIVGKYL